MFRINDYQYGPRTSVALEPPFHQAVNTPSIENLTAILKTWDASHRAEGFDPIPTLTSIAEIIEQAVDDFLKLDPDPLDDRHPARTHPQAEFGNLLKILFRNDDFMNKLVISYLLGRDQPELSVVAARVLLDCVPGLDAAEVFSEPSDFIPQLYIWAKDSPNEVLRAYSIGLLASALEVQGNAHKYRANNIDLMPVALRRLADLKVFLLYLCFEKKASTEFTTVPSYSALHNLESSNSTWNMVQPYVIGTHKVFTYVMRPPYVVLFQLLNFAIEGHAMELIFEYIDLERMRDVRLTFDALRYLTSLLVHRKFALEFIARDGVSALVKVPRASMASPAAVTALYYLSYNEEIMEKVCQLNEKLLDDVVEYALWCLEHSYESGMGSAAMFFAHGFYYRPILERFDQRDGLRKLYNYISTLTLLQGSNKEKIDLTEEQHLTSAEAVRNAVSDFKAYFEAHLFVKLEQIRRTVGNKILLAGCNYPAGLHANHRSYKVPSSVINWIYFLSLMSNHEVVTRYCSVKLAIPSQRNVFNGGLVFTCFPVTGLTHQFIIILEIVGGVILDDPNVRRAALNVLINYDISKVSLLFTLMFLKPTRSAKGRRSRNSRENQEKIWAVIRKYNGINVSVLFFCYFIFLFFLFYADETRALACRALRELAKWEPVAQILSKLPFIVGNELQGLMRQPVMLEKRSEHLMFCDEAKKLIETVTQRPMIDKLSHVIANTRVSYNEKELLQLIHDHLLRKGLNRTASQLVSEAELPDVPASRVTTTPTRLPPMVNLFGTITWTRTEVEFVSSTFSNRIISKIATRSNLLTSFPDDLYSGSSTVFPQKLQLRSSMSGDLMSNYSRVFHFVYFFRVQHSKCSHPVTTCPPFSLFYPHRCPEPRSVGSVPTNIVTRISVRDVLPTMVHSRNERYVFSRFRPSRTLIEHEEMYTSCAFSIDDEHLILGTFSGEVHWLNMETGAIESHTVCHSSGITSIVPSKDGNFLLTSSAFISPLSALWKLGDQQEHAFDLAGEYFVQFPNLTTDRIISTNDVVATLYDTETGLTLRKYRRDSFPTGYTHNRASFSPCDTMILNDGVLYDIRGPVVHTFDQLSTTGCSVFHPHGSEIIINTEVWDTRTFRLLHLVPALEQCKLVFNSTGNIVYAAMYSDCADVFRNNYCASFRTFDAFDYSVCLYLFYGSLFWVLTMSKDEETVVRTYEVSDKISQLYPRCSFVLKMCKFLVRGFRLGKGVMLKTTMWMRLKMRMELKVIRIPLSTMKIWMTVMMTMMMTTILMLMRTKTIQASSKLLEGFVNILTKRTVRKAILWFFIKVGSRF
ncbi:unnamed protein product [Angiostrongylus costaricensis]|uniref:LisH domain-containing protein n=1 Tax=Angiostrongylus costaricensis TaxID=334426 RepID=A0A158PHU3_ANGCS|nr:unnamed protein product [Angiostrongylus costaricensis]